MLISIDLYKCLYIIYIVIPGILMFKSKVSFLTMTRLCDVRVPASWISALDVKDAKEALTIGQKLVS